MVIALSSQQSHDTDVPIRDKDGVYWKQGVWVDTVEGISLNIKPVGEIKPLRTAVEFILNNRGFFCLLISLVAPSTKVKAIFFKFRRMIWNSNLSCTQQEDHKDL